MTLIVLLVAAIVLPCIYVVVMAYNDLKTREAAASDVTMRTVRVAESTRSSVDLSETLDARIVDLVQDMDDATVRNRESDIHEALNTIGGGYPQAAVSIFGASGCCSRTASTIRRPMRRSRTATTSPASATARSSNISRG